MLKPVKVAILSCDHGHANGYFKLVNERLFDLVGVSITPGFEITEDVGFLANVPKYPSDEALYDAHPELEAVIMASDNVSHMRQMREATKRGLHIFSMKVPSFDMDEYAEMIRLTEEAGVVCQIELEMRHHTPVYRVKEAIENGDIGELLSVHLVNYSLNPVWWIPWVCDPVMSYGKQVSLRPGDPRFRGGALADHPHVFDVLRFITGSEFDTIYSDVSPNLRDGVMTEDMVRIIGKLKNGVIFSLDPSFANNEPHECPRRGVGYPRLVEVYMTAVGTKGTIIADLYGKTYCLQLEDTGDYCCAGLGSSGLWNRRTEEFYHCIRDGKKPPVGLREHYNSILAMNAAYESIRLGRAVKLDGGPMGKIL